VKCHLDALPAGATHTFELKLYGDGRPPTTLAAEVEVGTPDRDPTNNVVD
jgi:hypothetical protein